MCCMPFTARMYWARSNAPGSGQRCWLMLPCICLTDSYSCSDSGFLLGLPLTPSCHMNVLHAFYGAHVLGALERSRIGAALLAHAALHLLDGFVFVLGFGVFTWVAINAILPYECAACLLRRACIGRARTLPDRGSAAGSCCPASA